MQAEQKRKEQLHQIKLKEAAAKANQGIGHKEDLHVAKLKELGSPLGKAPRMNRQKLGIPTQNPLADTGVLGQGQKKLYAQGTDTVPAMLTPGEAVIPEPAAQNPKNKAIIKKLVEEGREKNALRDGTVQVVNSDAPSLAYEHPDVPGSSFMNGTMGVPEFSRGSSAQANYNNGTVNAMYGDTGYGPLDVNLEVPQVEYPAVQVASSDLGIKDGIQNTLRTISPTIGMALDYVNNLSSNIKSDGAGNFTVDKKGTTLYSPDIVKERALNQNARADSYNEIKDKSPVAIPVPGFNRMGNVAPVVPVDQYIPRIQIPNEQTVPVIVPSNNFNANQTAVIKPINDIEAIDAYTLFKGAESGNKNTAKNPLSSASGPVQFTEGTWNSIRKQVPELAGVQYGSKEFYTDEAQRMAFEHTNKQNEAVLNKQRIPLTNVNRYVMHGLGSGDGARVLSNPQGDFRETLDQSSRKGNADLIIKQNPVYAKFKTNQDYIDWAEGHLKRSVGIGRDSSTITPTPINPDKSQPAAVEVGTPTEFQGQPPIPVFETSSVSMLDSNPKAANDAIATVAKQESTNLDKLITAIKASNATPEVKQQEAATLIEKIYGDKGIFNQGDLIRFAITAAGGMLTGGSAAGSLRYASRDALMQSDARNRERIAAERQQKTIDAQNARQDKSLLTQAAMQEASRLDAEKRADVKAKDTRTYEALKNDREKFESNTSALAKAFGDSEIDQPIRNQARAKLNEVLPTLKNDAQRAEYTSQLLQQLNTYAVKRDPAASKVNEDYHFYNGKVYQSKFIGSDSDNMQLYDDVSGKWFKPNYRPTPLKIQQEIDRDVEKDATVMALPVLQEKLRALRGKNYSEAEAKALAERSSRDAVVAMRNMGVMDSKQANQILRTAFQYQADSKTDINQLPALIEASALYTLSATNRELFASKEGKLPSAENLTQLSSVLDSRVNNQLSSGAKVKAKSELIKDYSDKWKSPEYKAIRKFYEDSYGAKESSFIKWIADGGKQKP
jgi:hypothetical protein